MFARWIGGIGLLCVIACTKSTTPRADAGADGGSGDGGAVGDGGGACACEPGLHAERIFLLSDDAEIWTFDPGTLSTEFVVGPICGGMTPYSMAVDGRGVGHVLFVESLSIQTIDLLDPRPCVDSGYIRTDMRFGLFGMSFAARSAADACADLYVMTYDGEGPFSEGPGMGWLGVIDPETMRLEAIGTTDFDGGELTGTGDGRLFAFAGVDPVKIVEYDRTNADEIERIPLDGFRKTNASAMAFFGGDLYLFTEAPPPGCDPCLARTCAADLAACLADEDCTDQLACAIELGDVTDACGGGLPPAMTSCIVDCGTECFVAPRARSSQVVRYDLDASSGVRVAERIVPELPIRVVGGGSSPCVPTGPF